MSTKITLHKGGTAEQTVALSELQIPDLWRVETTRDADRAKILECWHIAHALKLELLQIEAKVRAALSKEIRVWEVTGRRNLPNGGTSEVTSTVFGVNEAAARRNFDRMQARTKDLHNGHTWQSSELTFNQVQQK